MKEKLFCTLLMCFVVVGESAAQHQEKPMKPGKTRCDSSSLPMFCAEPASASCRDTVSSVEPMEKEDTAKTERKRYVSSKNTLVFPVTSRLSLQPISVTLPHCRRHAAKEGSS